MLLFAEPNGTSKVRKTLKAEIHRYTGSALQGGLPSMQRAKTRPFLNFNQSSTNLLIA